MNSRTLSNHVGHTLRAHRLICHGDTVIVALSGGADSCALLDILVDLRDLALHLVVAHLNHCLRGSESDADEEFCHFRAQGYGLPFVSQRIDVAEIARTEGINLEDAGRRARHRFLEEVRSSHEGVAIALAHHADDQAETVLMRLLRGSGTTGLSGMSWSNGPRIRPLLDISRSEIEAYLTGRGLSHREDLSNRDTRFLRNRIRHELLPLLETYNPAIRTALTTTASVLADEDHVLEQMTAGLVSKACRFTPESATIDLEILSQQPCALRRRIFRQTLEHILGTLKHFGFRHFQALEHLAVSPRPNAYLDLPSAIRARRSYNLLHLEHLTLQKEGLTHDEVVTITGPGVYHLPWGGSLTLSTPNAHPDNTDTGNTAYFDSEKTPFPWQVRTFRNGDRITPLGMTGSKKVKDIFIDAKVPLVHRSRIPLVFCSTTLIWVCGLRASQHSRTNRLSSGIIKGEYSGM